MKGKTILITGSTKGIGLEMAKFYAKKGINVIMNYANNITNAQNAYDKVLRYTSEDKLLLAKANVADRDQVVSMFGLATDKFGSIDILVNNAGLNIDKPFTDLKDDDWNRVVATNLTGPFIVSQEFARRHTSERIGHIINMSSGTSIDGRKNGANYCSSKAGVINLTKCMALELAPSICVNTIILGYVSTDEVVERYHLEDTSHYDALVDTIPLNRLATPLEIVKVIDFITDSNIYSTGQKFVVNGGVTML